VTTPRPSASRPKRRPSSSPAYAMSIYTSTGYSRRFERAGYAWIGSLQPTCQLTVSPRPYLVRSTTTLYAFCDYLPSSYQHQTAPTEGGVSTGRPGQNCSGRLVLCSLCFSLFLYVPM
jgi:hypothetical protein